MLVVLGIVAVTTGGCAQTTFRPVSTIGTPARDDGKVTGIRYYRAATYVLIRPDYVRGQAEVVVFTGPDTSVTYAAEPESWLATNTANFVFDKGILTQVVSKPDSTKFAVDTIGATAAIVTKALEAAAANAAKAAARGRTAKPGPAVGLPPEDSILLFKVNGQKLYPVSLPW